jgi:ribosomal protein L40E
MTRLRAMALWICSNCHTPQKHKAAKCRYCHVGGRPA